MSTERTSHGARRWLFVDPIPHFGGHEVMLLRWLEELTQTNDVVPRVVPRLLARQGGRLFDLAPAASRVAPFTACAPVQGQGRWSRLLTAWRDARTLLRTLRAERPEFVVCVTGALGYMIPLVLLARLAGAFSGARVLVYAPLLGTFASMGYRMGWVKDLVVRGAYARVPHGWVAISAGQAQDFRRWARPPGPVFVLPNAVARGIDDAPRLPLRTLAPGERLRVLVLGRLDAPQKGLDLLLQHLEAAPPEVQRGLLVCVAGEGPFGATLAARRAANPALAACLALEPWVETADALAAHDVLLLPSRFEGVPLVMLEALALGLPVVASDLPGVRAHVAPECLFTVGDLPAAFATLARLRDRGVRQRLADDGRARYEAGASAAAFQRAVSALAGDVRIALGPGTHDESGSVSDAAIDLPLPPQASSNKPSARGATP